MVTRRSTHNFLFELFHVCKFTQFFQFIKILSILLLNENALLSVTLHSSFEEKVKEKRTVLRIWYSEGVIGTKDGFRFLAEVSNQGKNTAGLQSHHL